MDKPHWADLIIGFLSQRRTYRLWRSGRGNLHLAREKDTQEYPHQGQSTHLALVASRPLLMILERSSWWSQRCGLVRG